MTTDDQQPVTMSSEDTDSQDDTETDHAYDQSSDQEAMMYILCPDLNSESDSDDSLFGTERLDSLGVTVALGNIYHQILPIDVPTC